MTVRPQAVIRFYGNLEYAIQCIALREITFLHPDILNDPFDPPLSFTTDFNQDYAALIDCIEKHHAKDLRNFKKRFPEKKWKWYVGELEDYFNSLRKTTFLFSTCAINRDKHPKDNLYMWSHYGNGHRGVAIEFDTDLLAKAVIEKSKRLGGEEVHIDEVWSKINYTTELPKITCEAIFQFVINDSKNSDERAWARTEHAKSIQLMLRSKSLKYRMENEWRLMWLNDETKVKIQKSDLLNDTITAIYLGCLVNRQMKDRFVSETKRSFPNAKVFRGRQAKGSFALVFEQVS